MSLDKHQELKNRTKFFALRIIRMQEALPDRHAANVIANQILRSATSLAVNHRAVGRARSKAEFISKLVIVVEEADETLFWLELLAGSGIVKAMKLRELLADSTQLVSIFSASRSTARG